MLLQIANFVSTSLPTQITLVSLVLEMILRLIPSKSPMSILLTLSAAVHQIAGIMDGIDSFLSKVLPQNLK